MKGDLPVVAGLAYAPEREIAAMATVKSDLIGVISRYAKWSSTWDIDDVLDSWRCCFYTHSRSTADACVQRTSRYYTIIRSIKP